MDLFFLRHGIAVESGTRKYIDSERPLTEEGIEEMKDIARAMKSLKLDFDIILSSPFERARHTAEIVALKLKLTERLKLTPSLASGANPKAVIAEILERWPQKKSLLLVGHEPDLSHLISILLAGFNTSFVVMKKGSLCKLSTDALAFGRCAWLNWLLTPKQMIKISGE